MRILFVHPNYRSGGAEIAGTWPPAWVAYLTGHLRQAGFDDVAFIDAMTDDISDEDLAGRISEAKHDVVGVRLPREAASIANEAGAGTADYILAHRIPGFAKALMRAAPASLAARMLSGAIARHAWTFAGSGRFVKVSPYVFEIALNPVVRGEHAPGPICHWHAAVFTRLYRRLVSPRLTCRETACCAARAPFCRFEVGPG